MQMTVWEYMILLIVLIIFPALVCYFCFRSITIDEIKKASRRSSGAGARGGMGVKGVSE